jgi:hypothetical protein
VKVHSRKITDIPALFVKEKCMEKSFVVKVNWFTWMKAIICIVPSVKIQFKLDVILAG